MRVPLDLSYTQDHEWLKIDAEGNAVVGITDYAQNSLGDITYVEVPEVGQTFSAGETFGVVESVKAASDLFMPVDGEILAVNEGLDEAPEHVNQSPYEVGWVIKIKPSNPGQLAGLLSSEDYEKQTG
jgi:glycine cleavage system H protein